MLRRILQNGLIFKMISKCYFVSLFCFGENQIVLNFKWLLDLCKASGKVGEKYLCSWEFSQLFHFIHTKYIELFCQNEAR